MGIFIDSGDAYSMADDYRYGQWLCLLAVSDSLKSLACFGENKRNFVHKGERERR